MQSLELPLRRPNVVLRELSTDWMLYDPEGDKIVRLNYTSRRIWEMCDGKHSLDDVSLALKTEFADADTMNVDRDVQETISAFATAGLLVS